MSHAPTDGPFGYPHSDLVLDRLPLGVVFQDAQGEIRGANPAAERILGLSLDQMRGVRSIDPRWRAMHEDGSPFPGEQHPAMITLRTGEPVRDVVMGVFNPQNEAYTWIKVSTWPVRNPSGGAIDGVYAFFEDITAQKTAQQQEAASEAHFDTVFAAMSEGLALHRLVYDNTDHPVDYRILDVNPAFTTQTGFTREAVVGRLGSEAYGTGSAPFLERYAQVARTGQAQVFEHYFEPLGRYFHISVFCPAPGHFGTVFEDITERKRTEATLQRQRTMLERTERIAHVGSWEWEVATDTVTWSDELFRIFQRDPEQGAPSYAEHPQLYEPEDMQRLHAMVAEALEHGAAYTVELRAIRRDGAIRICKAHGEVQRDTDGRITHLIGAFQDITEQKQAEAELERYRQELESLVEQRTAALQQTNDQLVHTQFAMDRAGIGIAWNNPETGQFFYANDELCRQLGYTRDEIMSLTISDIHPAFPPEALRQLADALRAGDGVVRIESRHRRKDQSTFPVSLNIYLHHVGDAEWLIAFTEDITARKAAEAELIQARDAAESANRAKSAFLANMSHEIRTPLNAVLGMVHLMRQETLIPAQAERLDKIEVAGRHLLDLINAILDLSKIESDKLTLDETEVRVDAIMRNLVAMLSDRVAQKDLKLRIQLQACPSDLLGDPIRLQQALLNYATNAIKFTEAGSITLRVFPEADLGDSAVVRFEVEDTGIGIAPERLSCLFTEFEQADTSITRRYGGTGLGLALTKRLAQLMGGEAGAISTPDVGSTFWFTARMRRGKAPAAVTEDAPEFEALDRAKLMHCCAGRRLLLVEDEPINREITLELIADLGLQIDTAENGAEALERVRQHSYDLILMDMQMPVMDGLEATHRIRRLPEGAQAPIVAMTANAFAEDRARCLEAGMNDFLTKPVEPERLTAVIRHWLSQPTPGA